MNKPVFIIFYSILTHKATVKLPSVIFCLSQLQLSLLFCLFDSLLAQCMCFVYVQV